MQKFQRELEERGLKILFVSPTGKESLHVFMELRFFSLARQTPSSDGLSRASSPVAIPRRQGSRSVKRLVSAGDNTILTWVLEPWRSTNFGHSLASRVSFLCPRALEFIPSPAFVFLFFCFYSWISRPTRYGLSSSSLPTA